MQIAPEKAFVFAQAFLALTQKTTGFVPKGFPGLMSSLVRNNPTSFHDLTGPRLFYDFPLFDQSANAEIGSVRIAAESEMGHPFLSIQSNPPLKTKIVEKSAESKALAEFSGAQVKSVQLVCFDYPRTGVLLVIEKDGEQMQRIFDPEFPHAALLPVAEAGPSVNSEGDVVHSLLSVISTGGEPVFAHANRLVDGMIRAGVNRLGLNVTNTTVLDSINQLRAVENALENQPEGIGAPEEKILDVPLINQDRSDFCVLASINMLLKYHKVTSPGTQQEIRDRLTQPPPLYTAGAGVLPEGQVDAFKRCFPAAKFAIAMDTSPTWQKARDQIDQGLPVKSGIFGHSRVAIGYQNIAVTTSMTGFILERHRLLWINDPNAPQVRLELYQVETSDEQNIGNIVIRPTIPIKTNYVTVTPSA